MASTETGTDSRVAVLADCDNTTPETLEDLRRTDPAFSPQTHAHSGLLNMLKTYDLLQVRQEEGSHWTVALAAPKDTPAAAPALTHTAP